MYLMMPVPYPGVDLGTLSGLYLGQIASGKWVGSHNGKYPNRDMLNFSK